MVVDDGDRVRSISVEGLGELGYTVIEVGRPATPSGCSVHLLFTDVVMPEMSGAPIGRPPFGAEARSGVLFTTGYT
jgi:CheY-like chemotaxis protein